MEAGAFDIVMRRFKGPSILALPALVILALANGCATPALWDDGNLEACKEPAGNPNLRLFDATRRSDLLVVFNVTMTAGGMS